MVNLWLMMVDNDRLGYRFQGYSTHLICSLAVWPAWFKTWFWHYQVLEPSKICGGHELSTAPCVPARSSGMEVQVWPSQPRMVWNCWVTYCWLVLIKIFEGVAKTEKQEISSAWTQALWIGSPCNALRADDVQRWFLLPIGQGHIDSLHPCFVIIVIVHNQNHKKYVSDKCLQLSLCKRHHWWKRPCFLEHGATCLHTWTHRIASFIPLRCWQSSW